MNPPVGPGSNPSLLLLLGRSYVETRLRDRDELAHGPLWSGMGVMPLGTLTFRVERDVRQNFCYSFFKSGWMWAETKKWQFKTKLAMNYFIFKSENSFIKET